MTMVSDNSGHPPIVLTIAGFDPSSGAGATADLQVFATHGLFGTACLTALTVQSTRGVMRVQVTDPHLLSDMLSHLTEDLPPAGIKIGMLGSAAITRVIADFLAELKGSGPVPVVVDPVLRSSSGQLLLDGDAVAPLFEALLPLATCITPNRQELAILLGREVLDADELAAAAMDLLQRTSAQSVIVTGGEADVPTELLVQKDQGPIWLTGEHVETRATHGTGCAFSSSLLCWLVLGEDLAMAARRAKGFVEGCLRSAPGLGAGRGPMKLSRSPYVLRPTRAPLQK